VQPEPPAVRNLPSPDFARRLDDLRTGPLDFMRFEGERCPSVDIGVRLPPPPDPIAPDLTGPNRIREFIRAAFTENATSGNAPA